MRVKPPFSLTTVGFKQLRHIQGSAQSKPPISGHQENNYCGIFSRAHVLHPCVEGGCAKGLCQPKGGCLLSPVSANLDPNQSPHGSLEVGPGEHSAPVEPRGGGGRRRFDVAATEGGNTLSRANENIIIFFWLQRGANLIGCDRKASVEFTQQ